LSRKRTASTMAGSEATSNKRMAFDASATMNANNGLPNQTSQVPQQQTFVDDELLLAALLQLSSDEAFGDLLLLQQQLLLSNSRVTLTSPVNPMMGGPATLSPSAANASLAAGSSMSSRSAGKMHAHAMASSSSSRSASANAGGASSTNARMARDPLAERPYRCSVPGCDKSYKNANGLKYHNLHGHCSGSAGASTQATHHANTTAHSTPSHAQSTVTNGEHRAQVKPYRCTIPDCGKSYKNLNGLKYHVEHAHPGAIALPLGKKAHVKAAAAVIAQAQERLQMSTIKAVVVPADMVAHLNLGADVSSPIANGGGMTIVEGAVGMSQQVPSTSSTAIGSPTMSSNELVDVMSVDDLSIGQSYSSSLTY
jgi:hypothetical protein